ncbi:MAG: MFS transporter [Erysipelotrichaceae bacterium]|nr:MFS transporter [Erysipelotrichaceae bacterium]
MNKNKKDSFTKMEWSWVLYDVGNSAFTMLACSLITIWFKAIASESGLDPALQTSYWAYVTGAVTILVAFIGPICGTIADNKGFKKPIFTTALCIGVFGCLLLGFINNWVAFILVFIVTKASYSSSLVFYDSMVTDVTTPERMDRVSSYGFAWGYIGSCIPFLICLLAYVAGEGMLGASAAALISQKTARVIGFTVTAVWWFLVSVPLLKNYQQKYYVESQKGAVKECFSRIGHTIVKIFREDRKVKYFLLAFFLYIDGVNTIIDNAINIGTDLNLNTVGQVVFLLATQVVAFAFSLIFSKLSEKYSTGTLIKVCISGYLVVAVYALTLTNLFQFGIMAFGVGMFQGSIQALSRAYYGKIIPAENSGEYFGLYDIFSKGASFLGSFLIGIVKMATGRITLAVGSLAFFFFTGLLLFMKADSLPNKNNE